MRGNCETHWHIAAIQTMGDAIFLAILYTVCILFYPFAFIYKELIAGKEND